jgi:hypothetical protein
MEKSPQKKEPGFFSRQRYWSIMLVGEHGRVIPVRRFKEIAYTVTGIAIISSLALIALTMLYLHQKKTVDFLQGELQRVQQVSNALQNERDVLKAKLVIGSMQPVSGITEAKKSDVPVAPAEAPQPQPPEAPQPQPPEEKKPEPHKAETPSANVQWQADIRRFEAQIDPKRKTLNAQYVIYNVSKPKQLLTGYTVLVLKSGDDPLQWKLVPDGPLKDGKPAGRSGRSFEVRNYRTIEFTGMPHSDANAVKAATVYVFLTNGELLLARDFDVRLPAEPASSQESAPSLPVESVAPSEPLREEENKPEEEGSTVGQEPPQGSAAPGNIAPKPQP